MTPQEYEELLLKEMGVVYRTFYVPKNCPHLTVYLAEQNLKQRGIPCPSDPLRQASAPAPVASSTSDPQ